VTAGAWQKGLNVRGYYDLIMDTLSQSSGARTQSLDVVISERVAIVGLGVLLLTTINYVKTACVLRKKSTFHRI
jgi:hypothetical protein